MPVPAQPLFILADGKQLIYLEYRSFTGKIHNMASGPARGSQFFHFFRTDQIGIHQARVACGQYPALFVRDGYIMDIGTGADFIQKRLQLLIRPLKAHACLQCGLIGVDQ